MPQFRIFEGGFGKTAVRPDLRALDDANEALDQVCHLTGDRLVTSQRHGAVGPVDLIIDQLLVCSLQVALSERWPAKDFLGASRSRQQQQQYASIEPKHPITLTHVVSGTEDGLSISNL